MVQAQADQAAKSEGGHEVKSKPQGAKDRNEAEGPRAAAWKGPEPNPIGAGMAWSLPARF